MWLSKVFRQDKDEDDELQVGNESCCWQRDPLMSLKHPGQPFSGISVPGENRGPLMQHFSIACIDLL